MLCIIKYWFPFIFGCLLADLRLAKDNIESCSLCWGNPIGQTVQNRTQIIRPTALWDLTSVCYSNTRTCIKYANSVDPAQTPDQRPFDGDTRHLFAESQTQIGKLQVSKWQITYKFVYINDYCLMSFWTRLNSKFSSDVNRHPTVMYFHFRQYLLELPADLLSLLYVCIVGGA